MKFDSLETTSARLNYCFSVFELNAKTIFDANSVPLDSTILAYSEHLHKRKLYRYSIALYLHTQSIYTRATYVGTR